MGQIGLTIFENDLPHGAQQKDHASPRSEAIAQSPSAISPTPAQDASDIPVFARAPSETDHRRR